jgi:catechol 2,3-dioxygenase-like lactoylglutathione lyase family enzyme
VKLGCVTLDTANAENLADFYQKLLGWSIRFTNSDEGLKFVGIVDEKTGVMLLFQENDEYIEPVWPAKRGEQQQMAHLDFFAEDLEKDVNYALSCGARFAKTQYSDKWKVMFDPAGHPFCIEKMP